MKSVVFSKKFLKSYKKRIQRNKKLSLQYDERYVLFLNGERSSPINDHGLSGTMVNLRSFSISGDIRVIYREFDDYYEFLDIGTHAQIYDM